MKRWRVDGVKRLASGIDQSRVFGKPMEQVHMILIQRWLSLPTFSRREEHRRSQPNTVPDPDLFGVPTRTQI